MEEGAAQAALFTSELLMSTKIFQGFRMQSASFTEVLQTVEAFRPWALAEAEKLMESFLAKLEPEKGAPGTNGYLIWLQLRHRLLRELNRRSPAIDTDFSLTFFPRQDYLLGVASTEHKAWYQAWCEQPGVEEHAYWDNTDRPPQTTEEAWESRAEDWSFLTAAPLSTQGFTIEIVSQDGPCPPLVQWIAP